MSRKKSDYMNQRTKEGFFKQSKKEDVRARSYFKIEQLDKKFDIFKDTKSVLDLGSAPGGWTEYVDKLNKEIKIVSVDLLPIRRKHEFSKNVEFIEDDFEELHHYVGDKKFDIVISDMAPEFSGDSQIDRGRVHQLNLKTIQLSEKYLKKNGNLAFKTFEGSGLFEVRKVAKENFKDLKEFKPQSSQLKSAETFLICFGRK